MLTLFTTAKPFKGHSAIIQRNALKSWTLLHPAVEVILFGDEEGAAEVCTEYGLRHEPKVERFDSRVPFVDSMFARAQRFARHEYLCYSNCDIVLLDDFWLAFEVAVAWRERFLLVSRRWDVDITQAIDFKRSGWAESLRRLTLTEGVQQDESWIDFFLFSKGLFPDIPRMIVGHCYWDNWMIWKALAMGVPVLDASSFVTPVHQNHGYSPESGRIRGASIDALSLYNRGVIQKPGHVRQIDSATHRLAADGRIHFRIFRRVPPIGRKIGNKVHWALQTWVWHPLLRLTRPVRGALGLRSESINRRRGKA